MADRVGVDVEDGSAVTSQAVYDTVGRSAIDDSPRPTCFLCGEDATRAAFPGGTLCAAHAFAVMEIKWDRDAAVRREIEAAQAPQEDRRPWVVYYWLFGDRVKIGTTRNLALRVRGLPPGKLLASEPGGRDLERQRHRQFAAYLASGREWFHHCPAIAEHIASIS